MHSQADDPFTEILEPGETLLWRGQPALSSSRPGLAPSIRMLGAVGAIAAGLGSALTLYALVAALRHSDYFEAPLLLMLALVTLSLFAACVRFATRNHRDGPGEDALTHYAITSRRVIVTIAGRPPTFRALANDHTLAFDDFSPADGLGSITFQVAGEGSFTLEPVEFQNIPDTVTPMQILHGLRAKDA